MLFMLFYALHDDKIAGEAGDALITNSLSEMFDFANHTKVTYATPSHVPNVHHVALVCEGSK